MHKRYVEDYVPKAGAYPGFRYAGRMYVWKVTDRQRRRDTVRQLRYGIAGILLVLLGMSISCVGNRTAYVILPLEISLLCLGAYLHGTYIYYRCAVSMECKDYEAAFLRTMQSAVIMGILWSISLAGQITVIRKIREETDLTKDGLLLLLIFCLLFLVGIPTICHQHRQLKKVTPKERYPKHISGKIIQKELYSEKISGNTKEIKISNRYGSDST